MNGASFSRGQAVAPGSIVSIFGSGLAGALAQADSIPLSATIADVAVTFNGVPAPLYFVSGDQINAQMPWNVMPAGTASANVDVIVTRGGARSAARSIQVNRFGPGIFSIPPGSGYAIAINGDGTIAAPDGAIPGYPTHPASAGDTLIVLATGLGPVDPPVANGAASGDTLRRATTTPSVLIGSQSARVDFAGLSPQFPGVNQLNVVIPAVSAGASIPIQIEVGGVRSTDQVVIAIR